MSVEVTADPSVRREPLAALLTRAFGNHLVEGSSAADRLRVLVAAENASRSMGGEAVIPFHYFRLLRQRGIEAQLITHERCRTELEQLFPDDLARLHFVPDRFLQKLLFQIGRRLPHMVAQNTTGLLNHWITQRAQRAVLRGLVTSTTVIHQPTPVAPRFPSLLYDLGAPVVMGPLNGGMEYPPAFRRQQGLLNRVVLRVGRSLSNLANRVLPGRLRASLILTANPRTAEALPAGVTGEVVALPENGVDLALWDQQANASDDPRFVFIGRLIDWKALDVAIEALARTPGVHLDVIGDGPMRAPWQQLGQTSGVADRLHFHGWLPQSQIATVLARSRALLLPSIFECGGAVVLEAMAARRAVIATHWGGPADYLNATCGILVEPAGRDGMIRGFAEAMHRLAEDPAEATKLGEAGRQRVLEHFDWDRKVDAMIHLYRQTLRNHGAAETTHNSHPAEMPAT